MGTSTKTPSKAIKESDVTIGIRIIRQYHIFEVSDSCIISQRLKLMMFIPSNVEEYLYIFPARNNLADLQATDRNGAVLPLINKREYANLKNMKVEDIYEALSVRYDKKVDEIRNDVGFCFFILPKITEDRYEEITISWSENVKHERGLFKITGRYVLEPLFKPKKDIPVFVDIRLDQKYQFIEYPKITHEQDTVDDHDSMKIKIQDKRRFICRLITDDNNIRIRYRVSVEKMVISWTKMGFFLGILVIPVFLLTPITYEGIQFLSPIAAGILALLFGLRALIFHDTEFMHKWSNLYIAISLIDILLVVLHGLFLLNKV
jgi:hypothetical protein